MFDGVHAGHRYLIDRLKALGDDPCVVTFSNHPLSVIAPDSAPRLLTTAEEKSQLLSSLGVTPVIIPFDEKLRRLTAAEFTAWLKSEYGISRLLLGFNNTIGSDVPRSVTELDAVSAATGVAITRAGEYPGGIHVNSTVIRHAICDGDISRANSLMLHPYTLTGTVVSGRQVGRTIGFPTANIRPGNPDKLIPAPGVYACIAQEAPSSTILNLKSKILNTPSLAIVNIGRRPTLNNGDDITIEAHIDGFDGDLYGRAVTLHFLSKLRDERSFPSLEALSEQISVDLHAARAIFSDTRK